MYWRIEKRLKQGEICKVLDISRGHYSNIERGIVDPSFELLMKFRNTYGTKDTLGLFEKGEIQNGDINTSGVIH